MDLVNLIEMCLNLHTRECSTDNFVEVIWRGRHSRRELLLTQEKGIIKSLGWQMTILSSEHDDKSYLPEYYQVPGGIVKYVLRRERLAGEPIAQKPNLYDNPFLYFRPEPRS
jgi:hypothetical protein